MTRPTDIDFDMLASDIADLLDRYEYPLDVSAGEIRPALPAFIAQVQRNAEASDA